MTDNITNAIKKTISIVEEIPDPYNKIAFEVVLEHLLRMGEVEPVSSKPKQKPSVVQREKDDIELIIKSDYEGIVRHEFSSEESLHTALLSKAFWYVR